MPNIIHIPTEGFPVGNIETLTRKYLFLLSFLKNQKSPGEKTLKKYLDEVVRYAHKGRFTHIDIFFQPNDSHIEIYEEFGFVNRNTNIYIATHFASKEKPSGDRRFHARFDGIRKRHLSQLKMLYTTLSEKNAGNDLDFNQIESLMRSDCFHILSIHNNLNNIIAVATIATVNIPTAGYFGIVEDFVCDLAYRGIGLGNMLMENIMLFAKQRNLSYLILTSKPNRLEANGLYPKYNFFKQNRVAYRYSTQHTEE